MAGVGGATGCGGGTVDDFGGGVGGIALGGGVGKGV